MEKLNFPDYKFNIQTFDENIKIFDDFRKKFVVLTPEEWVRQNTAKFLTSELGYPKGLIAIEYNLRINNLKKRADIVIYDHQKHPFLLVECKAPAIKINQETFDQASNYNMQLKVPYLLITNGLKHFCCKVDYKKNKYQFLNKVPYYSEKRNI